MRRISAMAAAATAGTLLLVGCGSTDTPAATGTNGGSPIAVVASTNVWGDIAAQIGGDRVSVTAIIDDAAADPHSFEVGAREQLAVSKAQLLVINGGHYDDFMTQLISASAAGVPVIDAVQASGLESDSPDDESEPVESAAAVSEAVESEGAESDEPHDGHDDEGHEGHEHGELNEHIWYDLHAVEAVAEKIEQQLTELDPAGSATYQANAAAFDEQIEALEAKADALKATTEGKGVAVTEPVPLYLLEEIGLVNRTPAEFSNAIEGDTDVPAAVLAETLKLFTAGQVALLVYNDQTSSPQTEQVRKAAEAASVPVVGVTETLPADQDYQQWMAANLDALGAALAG